MMIRVERLINKCNFMYLDSSKYLVLLSRFGGSSDDLETNGDAQPQTTKNSCNVLRGSQ